MKKRIFILSISLFLLAGFFSSIKAAQDNNEVELYFFWGQGCAYCEKADLFIKELEKEFPNLKIMAYEVNENEDNYKFFRAMSQAYNIKEGIPLFLIGNNFLAGYDKSSDNYLRKIVQDCVNSNCASPLLKLKQTNSNDVVSDNKQEKNNNFLFFSVIIFVIIGFVFIFLKRKK